MRDLKAISDIGTAIIISIILAGCSSRSSEEKGNHEPGNYEVILLHNSMMKKANLIQHRLKELKADSSVNQDSVALLSRALEQWRTDLVEVPGNEEHGHDHHDHVHSHNTFFDVTGEQILEIQKELDERLSRIGVRLHRIKPESNDQEHIH